MLDREICESEFQRMCEACDIETEFASDEKEDREDFEKHKEAIIKLIQRGSLVITEEGNAEYTPQRSVSKKPITFREPRGSALTAMGGAGKDQEIKRIMLAMVDFSDAHSVKQFILMAKRDITACVTIGSLFLQ